MNNFCVIIVLYFILMTNVMVLLATNETKQSNVSIKIEVKLLSENEIQRSVSQELVEEGLLVSGAGRNEERWCNKYSLKNKYLFGIAVATAAILLVGITAFSYMNSLTTTSAIISPENINSTTINPEYMISAFINPETATSRFINTQEMISAFINPETATSTLINTKTTPSTFHNTETATSKMTDYKSRQSETLSFGSFNYGNKKTQFQCEFNEHLQKTTVYEITDVESISALTESCIRTIVAESLNGESEEISTDQVICTPKASFNKDLQNQTCSIFDYTNGNRFRK